MAKDFPDLTGDGKVTRADVLKGRGVFKKGGVAKATKKPAVKKPSAAAKKSSPRAKLAPAIKKSK